MAASKYAFVICTAIAIICALAETMSPAPCSSMIESQVILKNQIRSTMEQLSQEKSVFAVNGAVEMLIKNSKAGNALTLSALESCRVLVSLAMNNLNMSLSSGVGTFEEQTNVASWVCAAATHLHTCVDGFDDQDDEVRNLVSEKLESPLSLSRKSSTIMAVMTSCGRNRTKTDLLDQDSSGDHFPHWLTSKDRRLLRATKITPNVVVATDGSGNYTKISEAIKAAPRLSQNRFVIYVKKGSYHEIVKVDNDQWNVMIYGDEMDSSIIYNNLSHIGDGLKTFETATFSALGQGFIARDIRFMNTAGAINQQAVALLIAGDQSVCYRCRIDGYQDSLCMLSNRQFYRDCHIYGTVDFIFGGAAVVIQKCFIYVRKPLRGQENVITAHDREEPHCPTGIVVKSSVVRSSEDITGVRTYLGRPWKSCARMVFMQNDFGQLIDPKGWFPWNNTPGAPPPASTIFLAEYSNKGNDASITERVKWQGVRANLSYAEAAKFTVRSFIQGGYRQDMLSIPMVICGEENSGKASPDYVVNSRDAESSPF